MLKLIIDTNKKGISVINVEGSTSGIYQELSEVVYKVLSQMDMEESIRERVDLFHGALLFEMLIGKTEYDE